MTSAAAGTSGLTPEQISAIDAAHLWHPYSTIGAEAAPDHRVDVEIDTERHWPTVVTGADVLEEAEQTGIPVRRDRGDHQREQQCDRAGDVPGNQAEPQHRRRGFGLLRRGHRCPMVPDARAFRE